MLVERGDWTSQLMRKSGGWERPLQELCRRLVRRGGVVCDVGAHTGTYTWLFASCVGAAGRVIAFEPVEANAALLLRAARRNRFARCVHVERVALAGPRSGARRALFRFVPRGAHAARYPAASSMLYSLVCGPGYEPALSAAATSLDRYTESAGIAGIDFLKIDTEGAELEVLRGAAGVMARSPRLSVLVELHPEDLRARGHRVGGVAAELRRAGLEVLDVVMDEAEGALVLSPLRAGERARGRHLLAVRSASSPARTLTGNRR